MKLTKQKRNQYFNIFFLVITLCSTICLFYYKNIRRFQPTLYSIFLTVTIITVLIYLSYKNEKKQKSKTKMQILISLLLISEILCMARCPFVFVPPLKDNYFGVDLSYWNQDLDFEVLADECDFIILRLGYTGSSDGVTPKSDTAFKEYLKQCEKYGIPYGVYYYSLATNQEQAKKEANYALEVLDHHKPKLGIFIDMEDPVYQSSLDDETLCKIASAFVEEIEKQGYIGGVYASYHWWSTKLTKDVGDSIRWIAYYNDTYELEEPYSIHQYSNTGTITNHSGNFDFNIIKNRYW